MSSFLVPKTKYFVVYKLCVISVAWFMTVCDFVCFLQGDGVKNSLTQGDEAQATSEGHTRSVRSLGTVELIRPQKLKYFESMCHLTSGLLLLSLSC